MIVQPDAATTSTIHGVTGLEFAAVFLADVCARRFPRQMARRAAKLPVDGAIREEINVAGLSDNESYDGERRLMCVALTRSERFLFISHSGNQASKFIKELRTVVDDSGGTVTDDSNRILHDLEYARWSTSESCKLGSTPCASRIIGAGLCRPRTTRGVLPISFSAETAEPPAPPAAA